MSETTLTHKELGRMLGVSETTIKSYRRKFPDCIPVANEGKPIRFTQEAGKVCLRIRELFSRGMAVPEVRARLEKEFAWVGPAPESAETEEQIIVPSVPAGPVEVELPQDYTLAMSGLAKSMVNLSMKQDSIMRKMESIDARLKQLGLQGGADADTMTGSASAAISAGMAVWLERASGLLERLEQLHQRSETSGASGAAPGHGDGEPSQDKPHGKVVRIRNAYGDVNEYTVETEAASAVNPTGMMQGAGAAPGQDEGAQQAGDGGEGAARNSFTFEAEEAGETPETHPSAVQRPVPPAAQQEPPRTLLTIPLVIQSPDGEFLGVAGRTRGRFCINDLKAMLMNHYEGTQRYSSHWQLTENGWLMTLEQKEATDPHTLAMLVEKTTTPRGNDVSLIEHLTINGRDENPVEMYNFINKIYEA